VEGGAAPEVAGVHLGAIEQEQFNGWREAASDSLGERNIKFHVNLKISIQKY